MHSPAQLARFALLAHVVSTVLAQDTIPDLPKDLVCDAAPCHSSYIENGVEVVTQRIIGTPSIFENIACCSYDKYRSSVDPPQCCYDRTTLALLDDRSRFSCPVRGVAKAADCPGPKDKCEKARWFIRNFCNSISQVSGFIEKIPISKDFSIPTCPTSGGLDVSSNFIALAVKKLFSPAPTTVTEKEKYEAAQHAATNYLAVVTGLGIAELAAGSALLVAIGPYYVTFCTFLTSLNLINSVCTAATSRFDENECPDDDLTPGYRRSVFTLETPDLAPRQAEGDNPCIDALRLFPTEEQCKPTALIDCKALPDNTDESFVTTAESNTAIFECDKAREVQIAMEKVCGIRKVFADFAPYCGVDGVVPGTSTTTTLGTSSSTSSTSSLSSTTSGSTTSNGLSTSTHSAYTTPSTVNPSWPKSSSVSASKPAGSQWKPGKGHACPARSKSVKHETVTVTRDGWTDQRRRS